MMADILSQINGRKHATTQVAPNLAYSDPEMAEIALRNIKRRAKHSRGYGSDQGYRSKAGAPTVNEIAWSEKVYRVASAKSGGMVAWRGGRKRWCIGISEKSQKILFPNRGGWRCSPASRDCREAPGS